VGNNVITVAGQLVNNTGSSTPFAGTTGSTTLRMLSPFVGGSLSPVAGFSGFTPGYNGVNPGARNSIIYSVSPLTMFAPSGTVIAGVDLSGTQTGGGQLNTFFTGSNDLNWIVSDFEELSQPKVRSAGLEYTIYPKRVESETRTLPDSTLSQLRQELGRPPTIDEINRREVSMRQSDQLRSGSILERSSLDSAEESNELQENAKLPPLCQLRVKFRRQIRCLTKQPRPITGHLRYCPLWRRRGDCLLALFKRTEKAQKQQESF
jgi:hypothetical protein